ncbi:MAG: ABC transporter permease [bacterium]|nr:ABC transporter permease [bacterium]
MNLLILRIAWRNIWRNTRRTAITLATMIICVGVMVWMITVGDGAHEQMIRSALTTGLGSIQIHALDYQQDKAIEKAIFDPGPVIEIAREAPGVEGVSVRLNAFGLISHANASQGCAIIGVDPVGETTISVMDEKVTEGEWLPGTIENERELPIVIGVGIATKLGVGIGDRLFLTIQRFTGDTGYAVYFVKGIFTTGMGEYDKSIAYVPINTLRDVMAVDVPRFSNAVHEVTILLQKGKKEIDAVNFLTGRLASINSQQFEVLDWEKIQPGLKVFINLDNQSMYIMMIFIFIVVAAGIMNTFLMAVFERIREFGILMSLGTRPSSIFNLVIIESALVGFIGAVGGFLFGLVLYGINMIYPWSFAAYSEMGDVMAMDWSMDIYPQLVLFNVMKAVVSIFIITLIAALYPAIKAGSLKPVEALRHV